MNRVIHRISNRRILLFAIMSFISSLGSHGRAAEKVEPYIIELTSAHNARSSNYYSGKSSILGTAAKGVKAKVIETEFDEDGHKSYHVVLQSGKLKGRTAWLAGTGIRKITSAFELPPAQADELDSDSSTSNRYQSRKSSRRTPHASAIVQWGPRSNSENLSALSTRALTDYGSKLINSTPSDIGGFCPQYSSFSSSERLGFWSQLISGIVKFESGYKANNSYVENRMGIDRFTGSRVTSAGLLQLSYQDQATYSHSVPRSACQLTANGGRALYDAETNLNCGVAILNYQVGRSGSIASKSGRRWLGGSSYWATLRTDRTRSQIQNMTRSYCNAVSGGSSGPASSPATPRRTVAVR